MLSPASPLTVFDYSAKFSSTAALGVNATETVFLPAANVKGVFLLRAACRILHGVAAEFPEEDLIAHTAAPGGFTTGDVLMSLTDIAALIGAGAQYHYAGKLDRALKIPLGKGLYRLSSNVALSAARFSCLYRVL